MKESEILKIRPSYITLPFDEEKTVKKQMGKSTLNNLLWEFSLFRLNNDARIYFPEGAGVLFHNLQKV